MLNDEAKTTITQTIEAPYWDATFVDAELQLKKGLDLIDKEQVEEMEKLLAEGYLTADNSLPNKIKALESGLEVEKMEDG